MHKVCIITILFINSIIFANPYDPLDIDFLKQLPNKQLIKEEPKIQDKTTKKASELPEYEELIKDLEIIEGLFLFYWDKEKNKLFIALTPEQLNVIYLANLTRKSGDATYIDSGTLLWEFPFKFSKLANNIQLIHVNTAFRADESVAIYKSIKNNFSNH